MTDECSQARLEFSLTKVDFCFITWTRWAYPHISRTVLMIVGIAVCVLSLAVCADDSGRQGGHEH